MLSVTKYSEWNSTQENVEIIRILRKNTEKGIVFHLLLFGPFSAINELWVKFANYIQKRTEILWEENEKWLKRCGTLDWSFTILIPLQRLLMKWVSSIYATKNLACDSQLFPSKHIWARWHFWCTRIAPKPSLFPSRSIFRNNISKYARKENIICDERYYFRWLLSVLACAEKESLKLKWL